MTHHIPLWSLGIAIPSTAVVSAFGAWKLVAWSEGDRFFRWFPEFVDELSRMCTPYAQRGIVCLLDKWDRAVHGGTRCRCRKCDPTGWMRLMDDAHDSPMDIPWEEDMPEPPSMTDPLGQGRERAVYGVQEGTETGRMVSTASNWQMQSNAYAQALDQFRVDIESIPVHPASPPDSE